MQETALGHSLMPSPSEGGCCVEEGKAKRPRVYCLIHCGSTHILTSNSVVQDIEEWRTQLF